MRCFSKLVLPAVATAFLIGCGGGSSGSSESAAGGFSSGTGVATLSWSPPTQNADSSPLTDLAGYRVYYGTSPTALNQSATVEDPTATNHVVSGLGSGTYYFAVAAYNHNGAESDRSVQASQTID